MEIKQQLRLSQQLVMTPQLQQAIKLLQMSRMELVEMVRDEMLENPVLEDAGHEENEQTDAGARAKEDPQASPSSPAPATMDTEREEHKTEHKDDNIDWER